MTPRVWLSSQTTATHHEPSGIHPPRSFPLVLSTRSNQTIREPASKLNCALQCLHIQGMVMISNIQDPGYRSLSSMDNSLDTPVSLVAGQLSSSATRRGDAMRFNHVSYFGTQKQTYKSTSIWAPRMTHCGVCCQEGDSSNKGSQTTK